EFDVIVSNSLAERDFAKWFSFGMSLLRDYRYLSSFQKFKNVKNKLLSSVELKPEQRDEIIYEEALLLATNLDFVRLSKKLENWEITNSSSGWSCIRKAFLLNSLKNKNYNGEIVKLVNESSKRTEIEQEKLWFTEIASYYNYSFDLKRDEIMQSKINILKSDGYYPLDTIIKSLTENTEKIEIKPSEKDRYTITSHIGTNSETLTRRDSVRFVEFLFNSGMPLITNIKFQIAVFSKENWFRIYLNLYDKMPKEMLYLSFQYTGNDASENFIRTTTQKIVFNSEISTQTKHEIFQSYSDSFFYYYNNLKIYCPAFIYAISELIATIPFRVWKTFINDLWHLHLETSKILHQKFYTNMWGISDAVLAILPYIEDNRLLNKMIREFYEFSASEKDKDAELIAVNYLQAILCNNQSFTIYKKTSIKIELCIGSLLRKDILSNFDLIKIHHFHRLFSHSLHTEIVSTIKSMEFTQELILYWEVILGLSNDSKYVNEKIRRFLISTDDMVFHTGIGKSGGRSFGGEYFRTSYTFQSIYNDRYLKWDEKQITMMYNILKESLGQLKQYKSWNSSLSRLDDQQILKDMLQFLRLNKNYLKKSPDFKMLSGKISTLYLEKLGVTDIVTGLLSGNSNHIQNSIVALLTEYENKPTKANEIAYISFLMRILRKASEKLELSLEKFSYLLADVLKEQEWPLDYKSYYIRILEAYYGNIPIENTDRIFMEYNLIKIANSLKVNWKIRNPIITMWLKVKKDSEFLKIQSMKL
ncbi:MAG: hypothetical protein K8S56_08670, partial [Candidatus Cloacimonetes bacterium]|nr:hypothetical protein [Candidatus Cloacimonadota bacterium]